MRIRRRRTVSFNVLLWWPGSCGKSWRRLGGESRFCCLLAFRFCWVTVFKRSEYSGAGKKGGQARQGRWGGAACDGGRGVGLGPFRAGLACPGQQERGWPGGQAERGGAGLARRGGGPAARRGGGWGRRGEAPPPGWRNSPAASRRSCRSLLVTSRAAPGGHWARRFCHGWDWLIKFQISFCWDLLIPAYSRYNVSARARYDDTCKCKYIHHYYPNIFQRR